MRLSGASAKAAWLAAIGLSIIFCGSLIPFLAGSGLVWNETVTENFNFGELKRPENLIAVEGFLSNQDGWYLGPKTQGRLVYRIPASPDARPAVALWVYMPEPSISGELRITAGNATVTQIAPDLNGGVLDLSQYGPGPFDLEFVARNNAEISRMVVDQIIWGAATGTPVPRPSGLSYLAFGALS